MLKTTIKRYLRAVCATKAREDFLLSAIQAISCGAVISAAKYLLPTKISSARIIFAFVYCMLLNAAKSATTIDKLEEQLAQHLPEHKQGTTAQVHLEDQLTCNFTYKEAELAKCLQ